MSRLIALTIAAALIHTAAAAPAKHARTMRLVQVEVMR